MNKKSGIYMKLFFEAGFGETLVGDYLYCRVIVIWTHGCCSIHLWRSSYIDFIYR
jgi:hypothetical protein